MFIWLGCVRRVGNVLGRREKRNYTTISYLLHSLVHEKVLSHQPDKDD